MHNNNILINNTHMQKYIVKLTKFYTGFETDILYNDIKAQHLDPTER